MPGSNAQEAPSAYPAIEMRICDIADASATGVSRPVARPAGPAAQCIEWSPAPCGCESQRHAAVRSETYARCAESAIRRGFDASGDCLWPVAGSFSVGGTVSRRRGRTRSRNQARCAERTQGEPPHRPRPQAVRSGMPVSAASAASSRTPTRPPSGNRRSRAGVVRDGRAGERRFRDRSPEGPRASPCGAATSSPRHRAATRAPTGGSRPPSPPTSRETESSVGSAVTMVPGNSMNTPPYSPDCAPSMALPLR